MFSRCLVRTFTLTPRALISIPAILAALWIAPAWPQGAADSVTAIDSKLIVDCRLPPQLRKLGSNVVAQVPGGVVKLSKIECEARGGLYVPFDAADPATALQVWIATAKQGDPHAQNRVGQLYELGIGSEPNYPEAAKWYRAAVDSGSRAAAINLAALYDQGKGVAKDARMAADLYKKAQAPPQTDIAPRDAAAAELAESRRRIRELEEQLAAAKTGGSPSAPARAPAPPIIDVGQRAGSAPYITILDPNIPVTRGVSEVRLRSDARRKDIIGKVQARAGIAELTINARGIAPDPFGFFRHSIAIDADATQVVVAATDRAGERASVSFVVKPGTGVELAVPPPRSRVRQGDFGTFHALVIGNRRYAAKEMQELYNAENDARAVAAVLERAYGFRKPRLLIDATHEQVLDALNDLALRLGPEDNLLVYYAGHGIFDLGKRGYWLPVDASPTRNTRWISNIQITDLIQKMSARKVLVISDSCYAGAMTAAENGAIATIRVGESEDEELIAEKQLALAKSRTVLGSGGLVPVMDGGGGENSVFTRALLEVLQGNSGPLEAYRLFVALEARVSRAAQAYNVEQAPVYAAIQHAGHEGGDFVFVPAP